VSLNPCSRILVQNWQAPPDNRVTIDADFDNTIPADYASLWNGRDGEVMFPNGFRKGQVFEDNNPPFCFNVANIANKRVQVKLQTVDDQARLCVRDVNPGGVDTCFRGSHTACFGGLDPLTANNLQLMVYIDSAGATTATPFWYRVRTSSVTWTLADEADRANSAESNLEMWCSMQAQQTDLMKFPKDLRSVVPPTLAAVKGPVSAAPTAAAASGLVAALLAAAGVALARLF
jgi:hypothetical protein